VRLVANTDPRFTRPYWCPGQDPSTDPSETCADELPPDPYPEGGQTWPISNTATVSSSATDSVPGNNSDTKDATVTMMSDIAVTASVDNPTPAAGSDVRFTLTGVNNGPSTADRPVVHAVFPPGFIVTQQDIDVPTMSCSLSSSGDPVVFVMDCVGLQPTPYRDSFLPGFVIPGTVTAHIPADIAPGVYTSTNLTTTLTPESDYSNNSAPASVTVVSLSDTSVVKTARTNPITAGQDADYTLQASNAGPSVARQVVISDRVPAGMTYVSASVPGGRCGLQTDADGGHVVSCIIDELDPGATVEAQVTFTVDKTYSGELCNTALVGSGSLDPDGDNNVSRACTTPQPAPQADVAITLTADGPAVSPGSRATLTAVVTNNGPDTAPGVTATFTIPDTFTDYSGVVVDHSGAVAPEVNCRIGSLICTLGTMPPGAWVRYSIAGTVGANATAIHIDGTVTEQGIDPNPADDTAGADIPLILPNPPVPPLGPTLTPSPTNPSHHPTATKTKKPTKKASKTPTKKASKTPTHTVSGGTAGTGGGQAGGGSGGGLPHVGASAAVMPLALAGLMALLAGAAAVLGARRHRRYR
jgi:uncharacterized repeat protein (TIGR01451 family)